MKNEKIILLRSLKFGVDGKRYNYDEPIKAVKKEYQDGNHLCHSVGGIITEVFAKEIEPGVYQSTSLKTHFMFENEVKGE